MNYSLCANSVFANRRQRNRHRLCRKVISIFSLLLLLAGSVLFAPQNTVLAMDVAPPSPNGSDPVSIGASAKGFEIIILSTYKETMKIGQSKIIIAASTGGIDVSWKSSNSKVASVDMYGVVTAKKEGTCQIIAKTKGAEAKCTIVVEKTTITLNTKRVSLEGGATYQMTATTSSGSPVTWKSSKQSVAIISDDGLIQAIKPGTSIITATADGSKETCTLTVLKPYIKLSEDSLKMYRGQTARLSAMVTSGRQVTWKSGRPSVATVDEVGRVIAIKHGEARISAKVDGVTRYCTVTVASPTIRLNKSSVTLKKGEKFQLKATVSSGNTPTYTCSGKKVATISASGVITAKAKGSCTVTVKEDGATAKCKIKVTD